MLTPSVPAPEDYYQNNCCRLFEFVLETYHDILSPYESAALNLYVQASNDAQRLFARFLTRKGPLFRTDLLRYREVHDVGAALQELIASNLLTSASPHAGEVYLNLLRKSELADCLAKRSGVAGLNRLRKSELVTWTLSRYSDPVIRQMVVDLSPVVAVNDPFVWDLARLLFFGEAQSDWSTFILSDLGLVKYETVARGNRQFSDRTALEFDLTLRALSVLTYQSEDYPDLIEPLAERLMEVSGDRFAMRRRDRALMRLAQKLEKTGPSKACHIYDSVPRHPARERNIRLLHRQGKEKQAQTLLRAARAAPYSEEEQQFCERFGQRNKGFQPKTLQVTWSVIHAEQKIEQQALDFLKAQQGVTFGVHVENALVRTLTGIVYWPIIFAPIQGAFTHPYQTCPNDIYMEDFVSVRAELLSGFEATMSEDEALRAHIRQTVEDKHLIANRLVSWSLFEALPLTAIFEHIPIAHIRRLTAFLIRHLHQYRTGMPDLLVFYPDGRYELIEVKGPNDQLQPVQRLWFKQFEALEVPARVLKIKLSR